MSSATHMNFVQLAAPRTGGTPHQPTQIFTIPLSDIVHITPRDQAALDQQLLLGFTHGNRSSGGGCAAVPELCPLFNPEEPLSSCSFKCTKVHAILDRAIDDPAAAAQHVRGSGNNNRRGPADACIGVPIATSRFHVNYVYAAADDCPYERYPHGKVFHVGLPNSTRATDEIPSHLVLKTKALQSNRRVMSHCAHYYFNRTCNRGSSCYFVHALSLTPAAPQGDAEHASRKIWGRMTHAAPDGSPLPNGASAAASASSCGDNEDDFLQCSLGATPSAVSGATTPRAAFLAGADSDCGDNNAYAPSADSGYGFISVARPLPPPPYASAVASPTCTCSFCMAAATAAVAAGSPTAACAILDPRFVCPDRAAHCGCECCAADNGREHLHIGDFPARGNTQVFEEGQAAAIDRFDDDECEEDEDEECGEEDEEEYEEDHVACLGPWTASSGRVSSSSNTSDGHSSAGQSPMPSLPQYHQLAYKFEQPLQPVSGNNSFSSSACVSPAHYFYYQQQHQQQQYTASPTSATTPCGCEICVHQRRRRDEMVQQQQQQQGAAYKEEQLFRFFDDFVNVQSVGNSSGSDDEDGGKLERGARRPPPSECDETDVAQAAFFAQRPRAVVTRRFRNEPYNWSVCHVVTSRATKLVVPHRQN